MTSGGFEPGRDPKPIEDEAVRRQLQGLFGASLFGDWPELEQSLGNAPRRRRSWVWLWRLLAVAAAVLVIVGIRQLLKPGLKRQVEGERTNYAEELAAFIKDGELERAAQYAPIVRLRFAGAAGRTERSDIDPTDPHLELLVSAEAALYRYFDADPARVQRIAPFIEPHEPLSALRQLARFTVLSRAERAAAITEIERLRSGLPNHNQVEYLIATACEARGDPSAARAAWERSANLGPAWLGHRFEQAWFEWRQDSKPAAQRVAAQIVRTDPDSPWARLAIARFELPSDITRESVRGDAAAPVVTPVQTYFELLGQSMDAAHKKDPTRATERLTSAVNAIHLQPPFLLDAFDWLMAENAPELARTVTELNEWPRNSEVANAKLEQLKAKMRTAQAANSSAKTKPASPPKAKSPPSQSAPKRKASRRKSP